MTSSTLNFEINSLPKSVRKEISDFVDFLKQRNQNSIKPKKRTFGYAKGKIKFSADFDAPLQEFKE